MIRKGFESVDLMKLKRIGKKSTPEEKQPAGGAEGQAAEAKATQKLRGEAFISRFAGLLLFIFSLGHVWTDSKTKVRADLQTVITDPLSR